MKRVALQKFLVFYFIEIVTTIKDFEEQFVTFFAVFAHQRSESFHSGSLYLLEAVEGIYVLNRIENIVALSHLQGREIARSFRDIRFLSHKS